MVINPPKEPMTKKKTIEIEKVFINDGPKMFAFKIRRQSVVITCFNQQI